MNKMNKEQKNYAVAKAAYQSLEELLDREEKEYIKDKGILNHDGFAPEHLWTMDDEEAFNIHNEVFGKAVEKSGLQKKINEARESLKKAEDELIAFGISLAPKTEQKVLESGCKKSIRIREKMLDMAFRLDTSTVRERRA